MDSTWLYMDLIGKGLVGFISKFRISYLTRGVKREAPPGEALGPNWICSSGIRVL